MSEERLKEIKEELAKISFSNIGHCVNTNLILDYITNLQEEIERLKSLWEADKQSWNELMAEKETEIERLNNIINELERYINEEYIYDELGMKIFDASELQDKLHELKGSKDNE